MHCPAGGNRQAVVAVIPSDLWKFISLVLTRNNPHPLEEILFGFYQHGFQASVVKSRGRFRTDVYVDAASSMFMYTCNHSDKELYCEILSEWLTQARRPASPDLPVTIEIVETDKDIKLRIHSGMPDSISCSNSSTKGNDVPWLLCDRLNTSVARRELNKKFMCNEEPAFCLQPARHWIPSWPQAASRQSKLDLSYAARCIRRHCDTFDLCSDQDYRITFRYHQPGRPKNQADLKRFCGLVSSIMLASIPIPDLTSLVLTFVFDPSLRPTSIQTIIVW